MPQQREEVYGLFLQYQDLHAQHGWWDDDMDRAMRLLLPLLPALQSGEVSAPSAVTVYDKVYVDAGQRASGDCAVCDCSWRQSGLTVPCR